MQTQNNTCPTSRPRFWFSVELRVNALDYPTLLYTHVFYCKDADQSAGHGVVYSTRGFMCGRPCFGKPQQRWARDLHPVPALLPHRGVPGGYMRGRVRLLQLHEQVHVHVVEQQVQLRTMLPGDGVRGPSHTMWWLLRPPAAFARGRSLRGALW